MNRSMASPNSRQRLDALLALPLGQFRRRLTQLTPDELAALETRIALQEVKQRWARGSHGLERHRAAGELARLARRETAARRERATRLAAARTPGHLLDEADLELRTPESLLPEARAA